MPKGTAIDYTEQQLAFLQAHSTLPRKDMAELFNATFGTNLSTQALAAMCTRNGWYTGRTGCYKKDQTPWNKGVTGYMGANKTSFKKGQKPKNWRPIGSERITTQGYTEIKVSNTGKRWRMKHQVIYERYHGSIPKGHVVIFADGDKQNFDIDNLILMSRAELAVFNKNFKHQEASAATKPVMITMAKLKTKVGQLQRNR